MGAAGFELSQLLEIAPPESKHVHVVFEGDTMRIELKPGIVKISFAALGNVVVFLWLGRAIYPTFLGLSGGVLFGRILMLVIMSPLLLLQFPLWMSFLREVLVLSPEGLRLVLPGESEEHAWPVIQEIKYSVFSARGYRRTILLKYAPYSFLTGFGKDLGEDEAVGVIRAVEKYKQLIEARA